MLRTTLRLYKPEHTLPVQSAVCSQAVEAQSEAPPAKRSSLRELIGILQCFKRGE